MISKAVKFFVNFYTVIFVLLSLASFSIMIIFFEEPFLKAFVLCFLFWNVGIRGLLAFVANWIPKYADSIADSYGWEKGQSFQREIAAADGAFGLMGALTPLFSIEFSLATAIGFCFCTFFSEFSGLAEVNSESSKSIKIAYSIKLAMCIDLSLSLILLTSVFAWKYLS